MALSFYRNYADSRQLLSLKIIGDGTTTTFSFSLNSLPVIDESYQIGAPTGVYVTNAGEFEASASLSGEEVTIIFSTAPTSGDVTQVDIVPTYSGV